MKLTLRVNGAARQVDVDGDTPLLWVLREELGLLGSKFGCGAAFCGACTVLMGDVPVRSCSLPVSEVGDGAVTTIEGIAGREAMAVQRPGSRATCLNAATASRARSWARSRS